MRNLIIWPSGKALAEATFKRLRVLGTNMVFFDSVLPGYYADYIGLDNKHAVELYKIAKNKFAFDTDWLPDRHTNRINPPKTAWEITPYYTRCYSKHRVFMRGPKPAELADIARITARQRRQYETRLNLSNPILTGLRFLKVFENESARTFAQAAEILGISLPTPKTGEFYSISPNGV